ncbi:MAG: Bacterial type II secretion system protein F domain protein [Firmicutes bacterium ADurb.Bin419]|nr:MAG: Bacterial type II secretion system protein F domain protein [Firmicutes bacterium ADurb.Bin419]
MFLPLQVYVLLGFGTFLSLIWMGMLLGSRKYNELVVPLDKKEFPLKELYPLGCRILEIIKYGYNNKFDRKLRQAVTTVYGEKYCEYYLRIIMSQRISLALTLFIISFALYGLTLEIGILLIFIMFSGLAYYYFGDRVYKKVRKREAEIMFDFPEILSKLALLTNAGMVIREAWENVSDSGNGILYKEMKIVRDEMSNGVSEVDAFFSFGIRCSVPEIKKFTSTLVQGITKGNDELALLLKQQSKEAWETKKFHVRLQGEQASSKLLIPITMMFIGVLIMIVVPIFTNLGL